MLDLLELNVYHELSYVFELEWKFGKVFNLEKMDERVT